MSSSMLYIVVILAAISVVTAAPTLVFPIAAQLPPVGRVSSPFDFALLPGTFNSTSTIQYTTSTLPDWLTFDSVALSFYGTPTASDVGQTDITVTASDGSTTDDAFTLLVTDAPSPGIHKSIPSQIADPALHNFATAVPLPSNSGVVIHPYYSFSLGFQQNSFRPALDATAAQSSIYYSAHERGRVDLPSWLNFDNRTVTFYGNAPSDGSYIIVVVGSDVWGYEAVESSFVIEVSTTSIGFIAGHGLGNITTVAGAKLEYTFDLTGLAVNGQVINDTSSIRIQADLEQFDWLSLDSSKLVLSGTTPGEFINGTSTPLNVPITISTTNASTDTTSSLPGFLPITVRPSLFTSLNLGNATANPGQPFSFSLTDYVRNASAVESLTTSSTSGNDLSSWLKVDEKKLTIGGTVPNVSSLTTRQLRARAAEDAKVNLQIAATEVGTGLVSTATLLVDLVGVAAPTTTDSSTSTATASSTGTPAKHSGGLSKGAKIAIGVVFGLLGLALLLLLLFCCYRRRKKAKAKEARMKRASDGDSFVGIVKSPREKSIGGFRFISANKGMARSNSARLQHGEIPQFTTMYVGEDGAGHTSEQLAAAGEEPRRLGAMNGILNWDGSDVRKSGDSRVSFPPLEPDSPAQGEIIAAGTVYPPSHGGSEFTRDFSSGSDSRASWESRGSFHWSSGDGHAQRPDSGVPSIPRPRQDFTPRYPRNASPSALAALVRPPSSAGTGHTFSEFNSPSQSDLDGSLADHTQSHSTGSLSLSGEGRNPFSPGPSGLGRFTGDSAYFDSVREEDEDGSHSEAHDSAVVHFAERRSVDTRLPGDDAEGSAERQPRLMPSKEKFAVSPTDSEFAHQQRTPSQEAVAGQEGNSDAFDDADEEERARNSISFAPSEVETDVQGLGYPSSAIYFGSPPREGGRVPSIRAVPSSNNVLSPPMPQMGNLMQQFDRDRTQGPRAHMHDGKYLAQANQNFNLHPHIHPPPVVSLSSATWSAAPPSTYRAEPDVGAKALPSWLHFDAKELELWGIPSLNDNGEVFAVRIIERMPPREKRRSYDSSQILKDETTEREVARLVIEVVDGLKSPGAFSLEDYGQSPPASAL